MGDRKFSAEVLARRAGLYLLDVEAPGVRVVGGVLETGPGATADAIATVAIRSKLRTRDERKVRAEVVSQGFRYASETAPPSLRAVSSR